MGYDKYITCCDLWGDDNAANMIGKGEWRTVVETDPELSLERVVKAKLPFGKELVYENPLLAMWLAHPNGSPVPFDFRRGRVIVKNPDAAILNKMRQIAVLLNARVQGEAGEFYDEDELNHD